ncbi:hypothetical protein JTB14_023933 [Gonioctena quinquepunctata]|nr:hypothetical protein JTB14_023933 [Gonioctena quinquepunctata]
MNEISNRVVLTKLETLIQTNTEEVKQEIKAINDTLSKEIGGQEDNLELAQKANSAPPTPTIRENISFEDSDPNQNSSKNIENFERAGDNTKKTNIAQIPYQAIGAIKKKSSSNLKFPTTNTTPKSDPMKNRTRKTRAQRNLPK